MSERETVSLVQAGAGEDLVLLHGYLACKESFYYQIGYFSAFFRVTAFDFWGMGASAPLTAAWSVSDYAAHTRALLAELGIRRACLLAHSFGGRVALKLLAEQPDLFPYALLTGCAGVPPRRGAGYAARVRAYRAVKRFAPRFAERHFGSAEYRTLSPIMKESYKKIVNEDLTPCLPRIRSRVLYLFGERDRATPPYMARVLHAGTTGSELVFLRGCTHFCFCEQPARFNAVAREFFPRRGEHPSQEEDRNV